eukprot:TRINITY_DN7436_c0_g1_i1.p1 TRINITY_DN7436_c0_g1~~TRINITY_DN7436_c0_g1_i1.p1  ORF type:complete len:1144 (+),score=400.14 TRINITY_DN7436_c0_g1_i1:97-3528(+)
MGIIKDFCKFQTKLLVRLFGKMSSPFSYRDENAGPQKSVRAHEGRREILGEMRTPVQEHFTPVNPQSSRRIGEETSRFDDRLLEGPPPGLGPRPGIMYTISSNTSTPDTLVDNLSPQQPNESPSVTGFTYKLRRQTKAPTPQAEAMNATIEELANEKKLGDLFNFLKDCNALNDVKTSVMMSVFDRFHEGLNATLAFEVLKLLITNQATCLCKYLFKVFFRLCGKSRQLQLANYIVNIFDNIHTPTNAQQPPAQPEEGEAPAQPTVPKELFYVVQQYYTSMLIKQGETEGAFRTLHKILATEMDESTAKYFHKTYEMIMKHCLATGAVNEAKTLAGSVLTLRVKPNDIFFNKLIDFSSKASNVSFAEYLFGLMTDHGIKPSIVTYNTLIDTYFKQGSAKQAWALFDRLKSSDIKPDNFTYTTMINGVKNTESPDLERALELFDEYKKVNKPDQIIYNCLLDACINAGDFGKAHMLLEEMKRQGDSIRLDEITYNTLIKGCCRSRRLMQAIAFYDEMKTIGILPNRITYNSLIDTCVKTKKMLIAWKFYEEMQRSEITPDNFTYSILINGVKSNNTSKDELLRTLQLLDSIKDNASFKPDEILYNSLMDACVKFTEVDRALSLFAEMQARGVEPSSITYGILIKAYGKSNDLSRAFNVFELIKAKGLAINEVTYGCLLDACVKNDRIDLALNVVDKMKVDRITLNTILYTTLIKGFAKAGMLNEALNIFALMKESPKTAPNVITYNCILDACVKCENLPRAQEIFADMERTLTPDLITYSTIIKGFCKRGDIETAYRFLDTMLDRNIKPDEALVNLILEGCYTSGKVDLGMKIFAIMNDLRISPSNITYSILIKIYGQARKLQDALALIPAMKASGLRPSLIVYTNLVQICLTMRRFDKAVDIYERLRSEGVKCDHVLYEKLVKGAIAANRIDTAVELFASSNDERAFVSRELVQKLLKCVRESQIDGRADWVRYIEESSNTQAPGRFYVKRNGPNGPSHGPNFEESAPFRESSNKENVTRNIASGPPGLNRSKKEDYKKNAHKSEQFFAVEVEQKETPRRFIGKEITEPKVFIPQGDLPAPETMFPEARQSFINTKKKPAVTSNKENQENATSNVQPRGGNNNSGNSHLFKASTPSFTPMSFR